MKKCVTRKNYQKGVNTKNRQKGMSGKNYPWKSILKGGRNPFRPESLYIALQSQKYIIQNALEEITGGIVVEPHTIPNSDIPESL